MVGKPKGVGYAVISTPGGGTYTAAESIDTRYGGIGRLTTIVVV